MHRSFKLLLLLIVATFLIACTPSQSSTSSTATPTVTPDIAATNVAAAQATQNAATPYT